MSFSGGKNSPGRDVKPPDPGLVFYLWRTRSHFKSDHILPKTMDTMSFTNVRYVYNAQYELKSLFFVNKRIWFQSRQETGFFIKCGFPFLFFLKSSHPGLFFSQVFIFILQELGRPCHSITSFSRKISFSFLDLFACYLSLCVWKTWLSPTGRRGKQSKSPKWQSTQNFSRQLYILVRYGIHISYKLRLVYSLPPHQQFLVLSSAIDLSTLNS